MSDEEPTVPHIMQGMYQMGYKAWCTACGWTVEVTGWYGPAMDDTGVHEGVSRERVLESTQVSHDTDPDTNGCEHPLDYIVEYDEGWEPTPGKYHVMNDEVLLDDDGEPHEDMLIDVTETCDSDFCVRPHVVVTPEGGRSVENAP